MAVAGASVRSGKAAEGSRADDQENQDQVSNGASLRVGLSVGVKWFAVAIMLEPVIVNVNARATLPAGSSRGHVDITPWHLDFVGGMLL
jgi:hypothetical protein